MKNIDRHRLLAYVAKVAERIEGIQNDAKLRANTNANEMKLEGSARTVFVERFEAGWIRSSLGDFSSELRAIVRVFTPRGKR
jgi:hypothetical protein